MIKLCVFDNDGVLTDCRKVHFDALNMAIADWQSVSAFRDYTINEDEHELIYNGLPTSVKLNLLTHNKRLPIESYNTIECLKQEYTIKLIKETVKSKDYIHIHELLQLLRVKGYQIHCASNCSPETLNLMLELAGYKQYFHRVFSNKDVVNPKPNPEIYLKSSYIAGVHPFDTLVLEDSPKGIAAVEAANMNLLRVESPKDVTISNVMNKIQTIDDYFDRYIGK